MTKVIDQFWIARGVAAAEINALKGRSFAYIGLFAMASVSIVLSAGIIANLTTTIA